MPLSSRSFGTLCRLRTVPTFLRTAGQLGANNVRIIRTGSIPLLLASYVNASPLPLNDKVEKYKIVDVKK